MLDGDRSHKNLEGKDLLPEMFGMIHVCFEIMDLPTSVVWRENFLRIKRLVLIGGPDDGVITPWQSRYLFTTYGLESL